MRMTHWIPCFLLLACAEPKPTEPSSPDFVWAGWNQTWETLSHRVSFIRAIATPEGGLQMGIRGGDWSTGDTWADETEYRMHLQQVTGTGLSIVHGETSMTVGPDGQTWRTETLDMDAEAIHVVLRGFELDTDVDQDPDYPDYDPALGYTSRGFGMAVGPVDTDAGEASFEVSAQVRWGPRDRDDMNAAMDLAQTHVRVAWTAIGHSGSATEASVTDALDLKHAPPYSEQSGLNLSTGLIGEAGIAGITGFHLGVRDQDGGEGGDYLRSFGVELDLREDGSAPQTVQTEVRTSSIIEFGTMHFAPQIDMIWITPESGDLDVHPVTRKGSHPVGTLEIDPE
jgi:hypothetical protein